MRQRRAPFDPVVASDRKRRSRTKRTVPDAPQINESSESGHQQAEGHSSEGVVTVLGDAAVVDVTDAVTAALNVTNNLENRSPRTDYTYSSSLSYRSQSPHRRVGSPNMARRPLHGTVAHVESDASKGDRVLSSSTMHQYYESRASKRTSFLNGADSEGEDDSWRNTMKPQSVSGTSVLRMGSSTATTTTSSASVTRTLSFGLDYESDGEDFSPARSNGKRKRLSHRATPLLASSHLTSTTANHAPSLLSSSNGRALYCTEEQQFIQNRAMYGILDGLSYTVYQFARIPTVLKHTILSLTSHSNARHSSDVDGSVVKNVTYTQDRWSQSNSVANTPNVVGQKKSPMVLRSRRRVMGPTDSQDEREVFDKTQSQHFESVTEDLTSDAVVQKPSSSGSAFSFFYTLMALIVWAASATASSVYCASKKTLEASTSTIGSVTSYLSLSHGKTVTDLQDSKTVETEDMDDPERLPLSWMDWLVSSLPTRRGKRKRRRNQRLWDEHGMDTRSKAHKGNKSLSVDDIAEHDFDEDEYDGEHTSSSVTTVVTTVVTTIVETVYDVGFEIEEIGRKIVGAPSRRQERDLQKRLRLAGYKFGYYDRDAYAAGSTVKSNIVDEDGVGLAWCFWLLPLLLLLGFTTLAGLTYWYGSDNLYIAVGSTATRVTSIASFLATSTSELLRGALFSLASWTKFVFWVLSYPFVYIYDNVLLWSTERAETSGEYSVIDSIVSVFNAGLLGVASIAKSAFTSVLSFCLWVFSGISALLVYLWELIQVLCSWAASTVTSASSTASETMSTGASATVDGLRSGLSWGWAGLVSAAGALVTLVSTCVSGAVGFVRSAQSTPATTTPSSPVVLSSSSSSSPSVDDLVALVLQSETLHQQLGVRVSSEVAAQTSPSAAQLLELQHTSVAAQTRTQQLLEQLQLYHDSLKQQLAQLNESLSLVAAEGNQGLAVLSAAVQEQQKTREQQMEQLQDTLRNMNQQISKVQDEQITLSAELKSCCQKTVLTLQDVERHVNGLISALIGGGGSGVPATTADLKAWIGTYFVAKDQMEIQMADMMNKLKLHADQGAQPRPLDEVAQAQTQQLVMQQVTEALQEQLSVRLQQQDRVKEEVRESLVLGEGDGSLAAIVDGRVNEAYRLRAEETNVAIQKLQDQVFAKMGGTVQTTELNETIKAVVAEAIALHMGTEGDAPGALNMAARVALGGLGVGKEGVQLPLSRDEVEIIVTDALKKYDADRTGLVDHALETGGGSIVSTRCTEAYEVNQAEVSILGIPLYRYTTNTPRSIIQPDRHPGQCWAFKGSQGYVVIRLVTSVRPTGFSLEHIPKSIAPFGVIDSAPKNFSMWGLATENDEGVLLGSYQYRSDGEALQYFPVEKVPEDYFPFIEFKIDSNHGNMKYTCVYRVRVHGIRMQ
ncbi:SUN domain [Trinorchestia longiramus]|nr:SUN domain [Trinorchestia longiramus]